jgi:hypothetical protein
MIPRWLVRWTVGALAILLFAFAAREVPVLAVLVALVGGFAGLLYLVTRTRGMSPLQPEQERERNERFLRDIPRRRGGEPASTACATETSRGTTCDACGRSILEGEIEYELVADGHEMRLESDCYLLLVDELVKLQPRADAAG